MSSDIIQTVSDQDFENFVSQTTHPLVVVDMWAPWCGPCVRLAPILEEIATTYSSKVRVGKMNVDVNTTIPVQYRIKSIPTLLFFSQGKQVGTTTGLLSAAELRTKIESLLPAN